MLLEYVIPCAIVYLYGAIPFSLLIGFLYRIDIRNFETGNVGATNLGRACGKFAFFMGFFLDGSKGLVAFFVASILGLNPLILLIFAVLGHCFSIFIKFKGGRGASTGLAFALVYAPIPAIVAIIVFIICINLTHYLSISSILAAFSFFIVGIFTFNYFNIILSFLAFIGVIIIYHKSVIDIINGKEEKSNFFK